MCCHQHPENGSDLAMQNQDQITEQEYSESLEAINAQLLEALEEAVEHADRWHSEGQAGEGRRCTSCIEFQAQARAAIKKAK